ncbi:ccr4-not transcription complex subunit 10, partial [Quercus suber]
MGIQSEARPVVISRQELMKRSEVLACASGEQVEAVSNLGNKVISGSKGSSAASIVYTDEFDTSVAILNIAVIWFHLHEYAKALSVLGPLYQNIEPIDETIALHICLLLLDVALACHDASKSAKVAIKSSNDVKSHHKVSATLVGNVLAEMAVGLKKKEKLEIDK